MNKREQSMYKMECSMQSMTAQDNLVPVIKHNIQGKVTTQKGTL